MPDDLARAMEVALEAATSAGDLVRADFHRSGGPRGHGSHADVDVEAERLIRARLLAAFPDWGYRGEETGSAGVVPPPRFLWLVDPNDGTVNYLQGVRGSSVSVALLRDRQPVLGIVYAPCAPDDDGDLLAWADGCGPATRNGAVIDREPWPHALGPHDVVLVSYDAGTPTLAGLDAIAPARLRAMPSIAYRLALAAAGDATLGTSFKGAGDWDYAGGHALLRGTGADLFDEEGRPTAYAPNGASRSRACLGGALNAVPALLGRRWSDLFRRAPRDPSIPGQLRRARLEPGESIADGPLLRRAHGCLLGQLAGDSLGSLVEFQSADAIRRRYPGGLHDLADGGTFGTIAGQPTDDSELALTLARSLVATGGYDPDSVAGAYAYWYGSQPFDIGATTARALRAAAGAALPSIAEAASRSADRESQANGSLMRISPLGIWGHAMDPDALAEVARAESRLTHPNAVCQDACAVFVVAVAHAVGTGASAREVYAFTRHWAERGCREPAVRDALDAAARAAPASFEINSGWVLTAFQNAFHRLLHAPTLEEGIVSTVMAGGDTDTNAAIAAALLGAVHGREAVPLRWRRLILSCRPLAGAPGVRHPRPQPFWPLDALELAERLLLVGPRSF